MKAQLLFVLAAFLLTATPAFAEDPVPEPSQNPNATYRLFRTQNIYTLLKLDTRSGLIWQVQWGDEDARFTMPINAKALVADGKPGRFTLYPTKNVFTFVLLDQETGQTWHVQWSTSGNEFVAPIN